jgi:ubiquitin-protein ligase
VNQRKTEERDVNDQERDERLLSDLESLKTLRGCSSIFTFEAIGKPPDRYTLSFHGRGIARAGSPRGAVEYVELHEVDMRLPYSYPDLPPDIRWVTPLLHPNVSFSGFIQLRDLGLPWDESVTLDVVCERLWDVARLAYVNLERSTNFSAKNWIEQPDRIALPVDRRILRDSMPPPGVNVIRYQRRGVEQPPRPERTGEEVLYIGEDTPAPPLPRRRRSDDRGDDEDILFIGDD